MKKIAFIMAVAVISMMAVVSCGKCNSTASDSDSLAADSVDTVVVDTVDTVSVDTVIADTTVCVD